MVRFSKSVLVISINTANSFAGFCKFFCYVTSTLYDCLFISFLSSSQLAHSHNFFAGRKTALLSYLENGLGVDSTIIIQIKHLINSLIDDDEQLINKPGFHNAVA